MFFLKILSQIFSIKNKIKKENIWLQNIIDDHNIDIVISDNRFGLHSKKAHCIFITHQLAIKTGFALSNIIVQKINYNYINKYNECWVPDDGGKNNLAGELSHPQNMPSVLVKYIGILSRFKKEEIIKKYDLLILLSGPEPQRSIFEKILLKQLENLPLKIVLVRGLPNDKKTVILKNVEIYNHLSSSDLNKIILQSEIIIARSGYTTIMDLATLAAKAIFVPTPGQTEQEYLAGYLFLNKLSISKTQANFNIENALQEIKTTTLSPFQITSNLALQNAITHLQQKFL
ncbi:MAG: glycosyltransferase [Ferruginibacter sp.]|nr:glycosyltransferase [Ferruginibacter sp.]